ncbi:MAG: heparinase II/III family protein, partial [Spirochaetaceae bacterium]|nr:heparinase II/III family protein [Spirochaetaceae bacterium]
RPAAQAWAARGARGRARAGAARAEPMPEVVLPEDLLLPGEPTWDQRYPRDEATFAAHERMMYPLRALYGALPATAFVAMLDGDRACRDYAAAGMRHLAGLDLERTSYLNTHQFHGVVPSVAQALDYLWDDLGAEREPIVAGLAARAREFHRNSVLNTFDNPLDSHSIVYGPPEMTVAALALYHHVPDAAGWLDDVERFLTDAFPGYGGADGGWGQGFGYVYSHYFQRMAHLLHVATGAGHFDRPWGRNNGRHFLYFRPPWSTCTSFGDASYSTTPALHRQIMGLYARVYGDPVYRWYAEQVEGGDGPGGDPLAELSARVTWPEPPPATPPRNLPRSTHLADTGWVALHSDLTSRDANVMLCFKSSRFGSFSHSHADQNSFVLEAYGRPLLIDSGFYPWYGSPHDLAWTRHTRAHNAVLVDDRGQAVWRQDASGRVIAFATGPDYDYCAGDATAAYRLESHEHTHRPLHLSERSAAELGVERAIRHVIFLRPAVFVVIDDVGTREPRPVQLAFHAPVPFDVPAPSEAPAGADGGVSATVESPPALARLTLCAEPGAAAARLAHADRFPVAPERSHEKEYPRQWHLTAAFDAAGRERLLVTVIQVGREGDAVPPVRVEHDGSAAGIDGQRVVAVEVDGHTATLRVNRFGSSLACAGRGTAPLDVSAPR